MSIRDLTAIVGIGATPYYRRGQSFPRTINELVCNAIIGAVDDAGLRLTDIDGFAYFGGGFDTGALCETLGIPEVRFTATLTGMGGGSAGSIGLAAAAVASGMAKTVVCVGGLQQAKQRYGTITSAYTPTPENAFFLPAGLVGPGHMFAVLAQRHMHLYGTTREHFAEIAISTRENARSNPEATMRNPLTLDEYMAAPLLADPHCLFDFCLENDGAIAAIVTDRHRAADLRQTPVYILASEHGGERNWGRSVYWMNMSDDLFASSGNRSIAKRLYATAGLGADAIDVAQIYDHFTSQVLMQLEDYGFCKVGEGGDFVSDGSIRLNGSLPINTDGGQLSCGYVWGMTHVREAVLQLRGLAVNQIKDANVALVTGGPSNIPVSGLILRN